MSEATFITRKEYKNVVKQKYLHWLELVVFLLCALQKGIAVIHVHEHF